MGNRKSCPVQGLLVVGQGKAQNVFTFSLLSFWQLSRLAVTPLRLAGPREGLHYITPDITAPKTHTHTHTGTCALTLLHTHTLTLTETHLPTQSHPLHWQHYCLRRISAAPTNSHN